VDAIGVVIIPVLAQFSRQIERVPEEHVIEIARRMTALVGPRVGDRM
jgi:hypothetical protein